MTDPASATVIGNLPAKTGRSLDDWLTMLAGAGLAKHGEIMKLLKTEQGVTHGYAGKLHLRTGLRVFISPLGRVVCGRLVAKRHPTHATGSPELLIMSRDHFSHSDKQPTSESATPASAAECAQ